MKNTRFACNLPRGGFVVARQHADFDAGGLQFADGLYGGRFDLVCNSGYGKRVFAVGKPDNGLRVRCQTGGFVA
ncbi:unknown [Bacteroides clarus CAG:160]|nr:unknown [Bacteroides clarus CAG:160]